MRLWSNCQFLSYKMRIDENAGNFGFMEIALLFISMKWNIIKLYVKMFSKVVAS